MNSVTVMLCLALLLTLTRCFSRDFEFEAELATTISGPTGRSMPRSAASGKLTLWLHRRSLIQLTFRTQANCVVNASNVAYSNDGQRDRIKITLNGTVIGSFTTVARSGNGHLWNRIRNSGPIGTSVTLSPGYHKLWLEVVMADFYGVEIDKTTLTFNCEEDPELSRATPTSRSGGEEDPELSRTTPTSRSGGEGDPELSIQETYFRTFEAEHATIVNGRARTMPRSAASGDTTLLLYQGSLIQHDFGIGLATCAVNVNNVAYSNDGSQDRISITLDRTEIGSLTTAARSGNGHLWNVIRNSGSIGGSVTLRPGSYRLQLNVVYADEYGVEIDNTTLRFRCDGHAGNLEDNPPDSHKTLIAVCTILGIVITFAACIIGLVGLIIGRNMCTDYINNHF